MVSCQPGSANIDYQYKQQWWQEVRERDALLYNMSNKRIWERRMLRKNWKAFKKSWNVGGWWGVECWLLVGIGDGVDARVAGSELLARVGLMGWWGETRPDLFQIHDIMISVSNPLSLPTAQIAKHTFRSHPFLSFRLKFYTSRGEFSYICT